MGYFPRRHNMKLVSTILYMLGTVILIGPITFAAEESVPDIFSWHSWHSSLHEHWYGYWWIFPLMFMIIFFFLIFGRCCGHWRWREYRERGRNYEGEPDSALDILNKRYARGEIEKQEYDEKKATIISSNR
jgi:putative membrane protein